MSPSPASLGPRPTSIPLAPFTGGNSYNYNVQKVTGTANPNSVATSGSTGVNIFANPLQVFNEFRVPVLGLDSGTGGYGPIRGFGFWNMDATVSKDFKATERIGATLMIQVVNVFNHFVPADPTVSLSSPTSPLNITRMTQRMSDMLQLVVAHITTQQNRNSSTNVRYASACRDVQ